MHPKRQHYVPQLLLEQFAIRRGREYRLWVFDLLDGRRFRSTAYKVAKELRFYDVTIGAQVVSLEPWLCSVEAAGEALARLRSAGSVSAIRKDERLEIARFVATLAVRGPSTRQEIDELPGRILEQFQRFGPVATSLEYTLSSRDRDTTVVVHNAVTMDISELAPLLARMSWRLFGPPAGREFCTSDSPVLRYNPINAGPRGNLGLRCRGIQLQIALSTDLALLIGDPSVYGPDADGIDQLNEDNLLHYNSLLAGWAHRWLYSRRGDFDVRPRMYRAGPRFVVA